MRVRLILLCGVVLAGCGGSSETKTVTVGATSTAAPETTSGAAAATGPTGATTAPAIASRQGNVDGVATTFEIAGLARAGGTTTLTIRLSTSEEGTRAQVAGSFDDGIFQKSTARDANSIIGGQTLDGVYLVDGKNRKKYLVGRDADNLCTCDTELSDAFVTSKAPVTLSAVFGAPPDDVRAVDVFVPRFGTFKDVPLG